MSLSDNTEKLQSILQKAASLPKGEYIPVPATAKVGQTVRVTAVDDTGKPTAWEAADLHAEGCVQYTEQTLTEEQKAQARQNIGIEAAVMDVLLALGLAPVLLDADGSVLTENDGTLLLI